MTLNSLDGKIDLSGKLLSYDGENYRLRTIYGDLTVDGHRVSCTGAGCPDPENHVADVKISGSASMGAVLLPALLEGFARRHGHDAQRVDVDTTHFTYRLVEDQTGKPVATFSFRMTTADEGFADLLADEADIVLSRRAISPVEQQRARAAGRGDLSDVNRSQLLALDALVPIVLPGNVLRSLPFETLTRIYTGQISTWAELGDADVPLTFHAPQVSSDLGQVLQEKLRGSPDAALSPRAISHPPGPSLAAAVVADPLGFGITGFANLGESVSLNLTGICGRGLNASRLSIKSGDYPFVTPMFIYTPARRLPPVARAFLSYIDGTEAQNVIRRAGLVDQSPEEVAIAAQGVRLANAIEAAGREVPLADVQRMVRRLLGMSRLTATFRFEEGAARLDAQSQASMLQLAQRLRQGRYDGRELLFAGFSDSDGGSGGTAAERARLVRDALIAAAAPADLEKVALELDAFGMALPMACNDRAAGRRINRRVEVWVR